VDNEDNDTDNEDDDSKERNTRSNPIDRISRIYLLMMKWQEP
jgi:hypothetical protein